MTVPAYRKIPCRNGCGGVQEKHKSRHCRACENVRRTKPVPTCPLCGARAERPGSRCAACYRQVRKASLARNLTCPSCRGPKKRTSKTCLPCYGRSVRVHPERVYLCIECGGPKTSVRAKRCKSCYLRGRHWGGIVHWFTPAWFRRLLERSDVEWTPPLLSEATGGRVSQATIYNWLAGAAKPREDALELVKDVLALEPCPHCGGTGSRDSAARRAVLAPPPVRALPPPRPVEEAVAFAGGVVYDPGSLTVSWPGGSVVVSRREGDLLAALVGVASGRWATRTEVAQTARWGDGPAVSSNAWRLRGRLRAAGLDPATFWLTDNARGWMLLPAAGREEAVS